VKKLLTACAAITVVALALGGCSSDSKSSTSSTTKAGSGKAAVCSARDDLQQAIDDLKDPTLITGGKSGIRRALNEVKKDLDNVQTAAKSDYKPQVDAVKSALDGLETAVSNIGNGPITDNLTKLGAAITKLGTTTQALADKVKADCPTS
jgi:hypothetical protein